MSDLNPLNGGNFVHDNKRVVDGGSILKRFSLQGKTAIITGAAAGIGLSIAEAYAEVGANIAIWYRTSSKAEERAEEISKKYNVSVKAYQVDMRDAEAVEKAIDQSVKDLNGPMVDGPLDHYRDVVQTNLDGTYYCAKVAAKHWRRQKVEGTDINGQPLTNYTSGSFIATASMSGSIVNTPQLQAAYNAAKAGVIHLIKSLAVEWARYARANAISPGYIITEISNFVPQETKDIWKDKIPLGREGEPHELQGAYLFLASDASTYATGANFVIDGGYSAP
ncbi:oxidoreductase [Fusarium oxysporum f. sp. lycopersici 4287]|uniref:Oxidoreductase n=1 Tax=Fusarium oxysporum f. sp. lycopersici (strain 4287 / CBS 123668 / FGSC 9935 / NRRL 34936) TaxID=426428 RepID=A0A0J9USH9_FUSO4|nr:oxidoreductase [Fusarium oxysporum f. sp. lycopersici 4287]KAJ9422016.1 oxidoreductase [Fusarium oxysporum]KNB02559.1 oxidoreductase [Fusarium oxysporum f. sp. lycopersici 4287]